MAFKVFLSYSTDPEEQTIVWRLQTLAASHGIQVFVPQRQGVEVPSGRRNVPELVDEVRRAIDQSDCVLAIITRWTGSSVQRELSYALAKRKLIIPIVEQGVQHPSFLSKFNRVFTFSRWNTDPGRLESEVLEFLKQQKLNKENQQALGALIAIGMGLRLLSALAKESCASPSSTALLSSASPICNWRSNSPSSSMWFMCPARCREKSIASNDLVIAWRNFTRPVYFKDALALIRTVSSYASRTS